MTVTKGTATVWGVAAIVVTIVLVVGSKFLNFDSFQETTPRFYQSFRVAEESGAVGVGWLPPFLPGSAANIHEKHNFGYNRVIVAFRFAASDFPTLIASAQEIQLVEAGEVWPTWLVGRESWFLPEIRDGHANDLLRLGFRLFEIGRLEGERIQKNRIVKWYMAVNPNLGIAYVWS